MTLSAQERFIVLARMQGIEPNPISLIAESMMANVRARSGIAPRQAGLRSYAIAPTELVERDPEVWNTICYAFEAIADAGNEFAAMVERCRAAADPSQ